MGLDSVDALPYFGYLLMHLVVVSLLFALSELGQGVDEIFHKGSDGAFGVGVLQL